jgi:hypothetical protein
MDKVKATIIDLIENDTITCSGVVEDVMLCLEYYLEDHDNPSKISELIIIIR